MSLDMRRFSPIVLLGTGELFRTMYLRVLWNSDVAALAYGLQLESMDQQSAGGS